MTGQAVFVLAAAVLWATTYVTSAPSRPRRRPARVHDERPVYGRRPIPAPSHTKTAVDHW